MSKTQHQATNASSAEDVESGRTVADGRARPVAYLVMDMFSRMIVGVSIVQVGAQTARSGDAGAEFLPWHDTPADTDERHRSSGHAYDPDTLRH